MEKVRALFRDHFEARVALLVVVAAVAATFLMTIKWANTTPHYFGVIAAFILPAVAIGGIVGWLTYSVRHWIAWTTLIALGTVIVWVIVLI